MLYDGKHPALKAEVKMVKEILSERGSINCVMCKVQRKES